MMMCSAVDHFIIYKVILMIIIRKNKCEQLSSLILTAQVCINMHVS